MIASRRLLGAVLAALLIALAWQVGFRQGTARGIERGVVLERAAAAARDAEAVAARGEREAAVARLAGERDMARATVDALRAELERAGALGAGERAELELYRRIGGEGAGSGLAIDTLERRDAGAAGESPTLFVTLVQARGRDRVAGRVAVRALGAEDAALVPRTAPDASGRESSTRAAPPGLAAEGGAAVEATFDLRFFETLELSLAATDDGFPPAIDVRVIPDGPRHEPFRQRFRREDIREIE